MGTMNLFVCSGMSDLMKAEAIRLNNRIENVIVITDHPHTQQLCNEIGIRCHYIHKYALVDKSGIWKDHENNVVYGNLSPESCTLSYDGYEIDIHESIGIDRMRFFSNATTLKLIEVAFRLIPVDDNVNLFLSFDLHSPLVSYATQLADKALSVTLVKHEDFFVPMSYLVLQTLFNQVDSAIVSNSKDKKIFDDMGILCHVKGIEKDKKEPVSERARSLAKSAIGTNKHVIGMFLHKQYDGELNLFLENNRNILDKVTVLLLPVDKRSFGLFPKIVKKEFHNQVTVVPTSEVKHAIKACDQIVSFEFNERVLKNIPNQYDYKFNGTPFTLQKEILASWV
jgi:hypothetical protein